MAIRSTLTAAVVLAALLVGAGAYAGVKEFRHSSLRCVPPSGPVTPAPDRMKLGVDPYECSRSVSLSRLVADDPTVRLPNSPLANASNVVHAWENDPKVGGAVVDYSTGIEVFYGGGGVDYTGVPADDIRTVDGVRALVFSKKDPGGMGFTRVVLPLPDGLVSFYSSGTVRNLVAVAATLAHRTRSHA